MSTVQSAIKYINGGDSSKRFGKSQPKPEAVPRSTHVPKAKRAAQTVAPSPARLVTQAVVPIPVRLVTQAVAPSPTRLVTQAVAPTQRPATRGAQADTETQRLLQTLEEGRRVYNEVVERHGSTIASLDSTQKRLVRVENDLRKEREQNARHASQIACQERELRKLKEGKRAVENLNSRLEAQIKADAARKDGKDWKSEADALSRKLGSYGELINHADKVLGVCALLCAPHSAETSQDILEAQRTMRAFQASMRA